MPASRQQGRCFKQGIRGRCTWTRFDGLSEKLSFENYGFNNQDVFQGAYSGSIPVPYETEWHSRRSPSFYFQLICLYYWLYVLLQPDPSAPRFLKFKGGRDPQGHSRGPSVSGTVSRVLSLHAQPNLLPGRLSPHPVTSSGHGVSMKLVFYGYKD